MRRFASEVDVPGSCPRRDDYDHEPHHTRHPVGNGDLVVITDSAKPAKLHPAAARCSGVTEDNFRGKVIERGGRGGKYFTVPSETVARERWPRLTLCGTCGKNR